MGSAVLRSAIRKILAEDEAKKREEENKSQDAVQNSAANAFRGRVIEKFGTVGEFAKAMDWSRRKASYTTTGRQALTVTEAEECAEVLGVDNPGDFIRVFHPALVDKWTKKGA